MPVTLGLFLFQLGLPGFIVDFAVGLSLGSIVQLGLTVGLGLAQYLAGRKSQSTPSASDVQSNIRQAISARRRLYGRYLVGSVIVFGFRRGEKSYLLHYLGEGPIEGYVSFRLDKKPVTLDGSGFVTDAQYQVGGRSRVQILTTLGTMTDEPFAELIAAFPELDHTNPASEIYGKPFRHRGCAMALQIVEQVPAANLQDVYPNNMPSVQMVIDGFSDIEDPRTATTGWSDNAGLCLLHEVKDVYGLTASDTDKINFASFADLADVCDQAVALKAGGSEYRYRCAGVVYGNGENEDRIKAIAAICNADIHTDSSGRIAARQKLASTPGIALKAMNGDHLTVKLEGGRSVRKKFNTAKVVYVDPALNYKENEVSWTHAGFLADDGKPLPEAFSALLCPSPTQAQRIGKLFLFESNPDYLGQLTSGAAALDLLLDPVFTLDLSPEDAFARTASAVGDIELDVGNGIVSCGILVYAAGATDWLAATDEQDQVIVPPVLTADVDDVLLDVTASVTLLNNSTPVIDFSWVAAVPGVTLPDSYFQEVDVSVATAAEWFPGAVTQTTDTARFSPVADGGAYDWRIRNIANGKTFDWQYSSTPVTVTINSVAPLTLLSYSATGDSGFYSVNFSTQNDTNLTKVAVYRVPSGGVLDRPTHLVAPPYGVSLGIAYSLSVASTAGNFDIYVEPLNISNVAGPLLGPAAVTVS